MWPCYVKGLYSYNVTNPLTVHCWQHFLYVFCRLGQDSLFCSEVIGCGALYDLIFLVRSKRNYTVNCELRWIEDSRKRWWRESVVPTADLLFVKPMAVFWKLSHYLWQIIVSIFLKKISLGTAFTVFVLGREAACVKQTKALHLRNFAGLSVSAELLFLLWFTCKYIGSVFLFRTFLETTNKSKLNLCKKIW